MLGQHLESEAKNSHEIRFENLDSLPTGLGEVYAVNFKRAFPEGQVDPAWTDAKPLVELIAAAREPITVAMVAALLRWDDGQQERVLETTALLFPVRDGKFHVFHKTIVDWLTGEMTEGSSIREPSAEFKVQRKDGHAKLAEGFIAWRTSTPPEGGARLTMWRRTGCDMAFCTSVAPMARARKVPSLPKLPTCMQPTSHYSVSVSIKAFSRAWLMTTSSCELWTVWTLKK